MSKHTPGPWKVKDCRPDVSTRQVWTDESRGSVMIATTGGTDKEANARLIAAAPDLLEALRCVQGHYAIEGTHLGRQVDAAIAKAEGRT